jgi:hypothetical protein
MIAGYNKLHRPQRLLPAPHSPLCFHQVRQDIVDPRQMTLAIVILERTGHRDVFLSLGVVSEGSAFALIISDRAGGPSLEKVH